jgi:tRNA U38,U39,U40 pseudouridine synthase TruA
MVGVLAACGRRELSAGDAAKFLDDRDKASAAPAALAAPAAGLFLEAVLYPGDPEPGPVRAVMTIE